MTTHWTEAAIAAELKGRFYGLDGKCKNEERERKEQEERELADALRAMRQAQAQKFIVAKGPLTPAAIIAAVSHAHHLGVADVVSRARSRHIAHARQHACVLMRQLTELSFQDIAHAVNITDHSTAHHAVKIWERRSHLYEAEDNKARKMLGVNQ